MEKTFAKRLKQILILAVVLNLVIIIMQGISTSNTIENSKKALVLIGKTALSSFEGGRRAQLLLSTNSAQRFRSFIDNIGEESGVKSLYLFDIEGNILLNTKNITPPSFSPKEKPQAAIETDQGLFIYQVLPPTRHMMQGGMMQGQPPSGMRVPFDDDKILVAGVIMDTAPYKSVIRSEVSFLIGMLILELLLIAVYIYTARILNLNAEQSKRLEASEREAELGKMSRVMAHELKNPLSTVKGLMEFSAKKAEGNLKEIAESCVDELSRLDRIINDYLSYGKDMTLIVSETDLKDLAENTAKLLQIDAQNKGLNLVITGNSSIINADTEKMRQVLFNLMLNAIQGAPEDTDINVDVSHTKLTITNDIKDRDFEPENLGKPFYTTKTVGTGLGLAIVKRIAQLHGFSVEIKATEIFSVQIKYK